MKTASVIVMGLAMVLVSALVPMQSARAADLQLIDAPSGLAWSGEDVAHAGAGSAAMVLAAAAGAGEMGCRTHCETIERVWRRLSSVIGGQQKASARPIELSLHVVQSTDVDAFAAPDGTLVLSEDFVRRRHIDGAQLAFVLAHELAHVLLEHERQALTAALAILPRVASRTVEDIYVEFGFNLSVVRLLEPVRHQAEYEADELGLQIAALAGYPPAEQLGYMENEAAADSPVDTLVSTHPSGPSRLVRLRARLPLAERIHVYAAQHDLQAP
jgi:predicted Zn-dependent protease